MTLFICLVLRGPVYTACFKASTATLLQDMQIWNAKPLMRSLAGLIAAEFYAKSTEAEVCYRNGQRYRAYLAEQPAEAALSHKQVSFSTDKVLLITGGTRGLGLLCARHFVKTYGVKRLVLIGREEPSAA